MLPRKEASNRSHPEKLTVDTTSTYIKRIRAAFSHAAIRDGRPGAPTPRHKNKFFEIVRKDMTLAYSIPSCSIYVPIDRSNIAAQLRTASSSNLPAGNL